MELPFAVEGDPNEDDDSLVIAASQESLYSQPSTTSRTTNYTQTIRSTSHKLASVLTQFIGTSNAISSSLDNQVIVPPGTDEEPIVTMESDDPPAPPIDVLTMLITGPINQENNPIVDLSEQANRAMNQATLAKKKGDLKQALDSHSAAAKILIQAAKLCQDRNAQSMAKSFLLLAQTQAKTALVLKKVVNLQPNIIDLNNESNTSQKDRLRATVRGALSTKTEADMSNSVFLGKATQKTTPVQKSNETTTPQSKDRNAVDEMMELERELKAMDLNLEMGSSIAALDARAQNRLKNSVIDGSFMVVPPGSSSYMSSSTIWSNSPARSTVAPRAPRAKDRVSTILDASSSHRHPPTHPQSYILPPPIPAKNTGGLESSWWGASSSAGASQVLTSSVISLASHAGGDADTSSPANRKQLMRLMDSLKALGDENAALLREVESAEAARREARAAKEQMQRFKVEYEERFKQMKLGLAKYRAEHGDEALGNPSYFLKARADEQDRQEMIRKLTLELHKAKEELKKKDKVLAKYEVFYREVKARSALKTAQRQKEGKR